jgi:polyphosphate kinase 2 (PPK2 family)
MLEIEQNFRVSGRRGIVVFEGWDVGGKGGAIRRLTAKLDPHWLRVWATGPPGPRERRRHYLFRLWERLPLPGHLAVFDRNWYGRVLVERIEGLMKRDEWQRAHREINEFERLLIDDGIRLVKISLHRNSPGAQTPALTTGRSAPTRAVE